MSSFRFLRHFLCSFRDLAAREGLLEALDASQWTSSLVCTPGQALDGDVPVLLQSPLHSSAHATGTGTAMRDSPASLTDVASPLAGAHESKLLEDDDDEDDDGIPAEMDAVIYDVPPPMELNEVSTDSGMKPVVALKSHMSHHVLFSAASSTPSEPASQISVAPDWFSSLGVGEPPFTTWTPKLQGCVDFIWFTPVRCLNVCHVLMLQFIVLICSFRALLRLLGCSACLRGRSWMATCQRSAYPLTTWPSCQNFDLNNHALQQIGESIMNGCIVTYII